MTVSVIPIFKTRPLLGAKEGEEPEIKFPEDNICYLVGQNGLFQQVKNSFYSSRRKVTDYPKFLAKIEECIELHIYKLPIVKLREAEKFFTAVYNEHKSEAVVLLYYNSETKFWKMLPPEQEVSAGAVDYDATKVHLDPEKFKGFELFGSIHSHASMAAFHSGTDDHDEFKFDGLHITIGGLDTPNHSYACRWLCNGKPYTATLSGCIEGLPPDFPEEWLQVVKKKTYQATPYGGPNTPGFPPYNQRSWNGEDGEETSWVGHTGSEGTNSNPMSPSNSNSLVPESKNSSSEIDHPSESEIPTGKFERVGSFDEILEESEYIKPENVNGNRPPELAFPPQADERPLLTQPSVAAVEPTVAVVEKEKGCKKGSGCRKLKKA